MVGLMDDNGRFNGRIKLAGAGGRFVSFPGTEKSSISLLRSMPVLGDR